MSTAALVSVDEYLATSYRPDREYVDGALIERNVGRKDHSKLQRAILLWFESRIGALRLEAFPEQRIRISAQRYRIPDVCVVHQPEPDEQVFSSPPYICIEILSPDDSFARMQSRFDDYFSMGASNVWAIDPVNQRGWSITPGGHFEALDRVLRTADSAVELPLADLFRNRTQEA